MDSDIFIIYEKLHQSYPISVNSSLTVNPNFKIDFPILCGTSSLGKLEMYFDDVSFAFYAKNDNGEVFAHWHLQTIADAEKAVIDFMNGKITLIQFGQPYNL